MESITLSTDKKVEILLTLHNTHRSEITHHREMQFRIFSWTSSLFIAIAASLFAFGAQWPPLKPLGPSLITAITLAVMTTSLLLIRRNARALESNARTVVRIDGMLGLFEKGHYTTDESVYSQSWQRWGTPDRRASLETWFYIVTSIAVGTVLIAIAWLFA